MASYVDIKNTLDFAVSFARTSAFPLDKHQMFGSYDAAVAAAATAENAGSSNTVYYYGMTLVVFENDEAKMYIIQGDNTLKEVGAATYGDDKSIVLDATSGKLSLKSFGEEYFAYHAADETHPDAYYEKVTGWKEGLQPRVVGTEVDGYSLAWYEPSATTVEGLQDNIATLQTKTDETNAKVAEVEAVVNDNTAALETLNGDASVEGSVKKTVADQIAAIVAGAPESLNTLKELSDWISTHTEDATQMNSNITANATAIAALETLVGELPEGAVANDVFGYIAEAVAAEAARAEAAEQALSDRIQTLENKKTIGAITADGNGNIAVDGETMNVYTAPDASTTQAGVLKVDGTTINIVNGAATVVAIEAAKVTGLDEKINAAVAISSDETNILEKKEDGLFVPKTEIVAAADVAASVDEASDTKAASEKLLMSSLTWKTTM